MQPPSRLASLLLALVLVCNSSALPPFSWDTVQTYIHCANMSGPWNDAAVAQLAKASFVVFEKVHGVFAPPANTSAETKIAAACKHTSNLLYRTCRPNPVCPSACV